MTFSAAYKADMKTWAYDELGSFFGLILESSCILRKYQWNCKMFLYSLYIVRSGKHPVFHWKGKWYSPGECP